MGRVWAGSPPLLCRHPGGNPLLSRGDILESWKLIFDRSLAIDVQTQIQSIEIGQDLAWLTALETVRLRPRPISYPREECMSFGYTGARERVGVWPYTSRSRNPRREAWRGLASDLRSRTFELSHGLLPRRGWP